MLRVDAELYNFYVFYYNVEASITMQTFLIASTNKFFIDREIKNVSKGLKVSPVNLFEINPQISLTIAEARKITQIVTLKPYGGGDRLIIINGVEKATLEASNALLKILEEPPISNFIILVTDNINKLLPTIVSRCQIISDNKANEKMKENKDTKEILRQILASSPGKRILLSQKVANTREEAIQLLSDFIITLEGLLHSRDEQLGLSASQIADLLKKISTAKNYLERYINFRATLDILFLGFPKKS